MIQLDHLSKQFGQLVAVKDLTLEVPSGQIYGLLGHNGAGKSTAIGMILGQVWPTDGHIRICGHDVITQRRRALRNVGAIFETPSFYDYLSGFRNLAILSSYTAPTAAECILEVLDWVGLSGREYSKVSTYSHGMRSRLALAQALLPKPQLLILDEPSDGLDPEGIHEMRHTILRLHRELGLTILLSSHLLFEVEQLCTHIAVLSQGQLVFEGTLAEARRRDQWIRLKVADFSDAIRMLTEAKLISQHRDGELVALESGIGTDHLIRFLVERGVPVYQVSVEDESLESFYLRLMNRQRQESPLPCSTPI